MAAISFRRVCSFAGLIIAAFALVGHRVANVLAVDVGEPDVIGWADEGDSNTIMCIKVFKLLLDHGGTTIQDGDIASGTLAVNPKYAKYANAMLKSALLTGKGVTASIDPASGRVTLRTDGGAAKSDNGEVIDLNLLLQVSIDSMAGELPPVCKDILIKRLVVSAGAGGGVGDPHLTTLDNVCYDFQAPGVFRLFESGNLQVQVFQHKCTPTAHLGSHSPSCYQGVAVAFAGSVAKFFIADNKVVVAKGSSSLEWLTVHKTNGKTEGYRVFTTVDDATYVDIMLTHWIGNYPLLNVGLRVSPYFKRASVDGLLGNWNGIKNDDSTNNAVLVKRHGFILSDNLFTCTDSACNAFTSAPTVKDRNATRVPSVMTLQRQGFSPIDAVTIAMTSFTPTLVSAAAPALRRRTQTDTANDGDDDDDDAHVKYVTARANELCPRVFAQVAVCEQYVTNTTNYIHTVCVGDAVLVGDLSIVDTTKLAYLRACRRELDARIEANTSTDIETAQLVSDRKALAFGDLTTCPFSCSGRGACLAAACKCDLGFTGVACDIVV